MLNKVKSTAAQLGEGMKAIVLALTGLAVILGYAATMVFGLEAIFWVAMIMWPVAMINMFYWSSAKGC